MCYLTLETHLSSVSNNVCRNDVANTHRHSDRIQHKNNLKRAKGIERYLSSFKQINLSTDGLAHYTPTNTHTYSMHLCAVHMHESYCGSVTDAYILLFAYTLYFVLSFSFSFLLLLVLFSFLFSLLLLFCFVFISFCFLHFTLHASLWQIDAAYEEG